MPAAYCLSFLQPPYAADADIFAPRFSSFSIHDFRPPPYAYAMISPPLRLIRRRHISPIHDAFAFFDIISPPDIFTFSPLF